MIDNEAFDKRVKELYESQQRMCAAKKYKSGSLKGLIRVQAIILPFKEADLQLWLWRQVGLQAKPCPYCGAPIDILSLTLDHVIPRTLGGSMGLDNLEPCCVDCNTWKGGLTKEDFLALLAWLRTIPPYAAADIKSRIMAGGMGKKMLMINRAQRARDGAQRAKPQPRYRPPMSQQKAMRYEEPF